MLLLSYCQTTYSPSSAHASDTECAETEISNNDFIETERLLHPENAVFFFRENRPFCEPLHAAHMAYPADEAIARLTAVFPSSTILRQRTDYGSEALYSFGSSSGRVIYYFSLIRLQNDETLFVRWPDKPISD